MSRTRIFAISIDKVTLGEATARCLDWTGGDRSCLVVTPNAEIAYAAAKDESLAQIVNGADLAIPDGAGIVLASKILGDPVPEKVAGVDLATNILKELDARGRGRIYLLGARPEVVAEAARRIARQYPHVIIAGYRDGFFSAAEEPEIIREIRQAQVDVLYVGMGVPRQERWLAVHLAELQAKVSIGCGGTLDVWAGAVQRAPRWMVKANLEWLFRIVKFGRYSRSLPPLVKFMLMVFAVRLGLRRNG